MTKRIIWLAQPNYTFGRNAFLPYSAGVLWAYAAADPLIATHYELGGLLALRDPIPHVIERMRRSPPSVLALSCYLWNWTYSMALARAVREAFPDCLVIAGGPQVPDVLPHAFMGVYPIDVAIHGEGEKPLVMALTAWATGEPVLKEYTGPGLTEPELLATPSPYLSGLFDGFMADTRYDWHGLQETNRGCPYSCSFCVWGSATMSKVRARDLSMVKAELDWMSANRIELAYNCDANFGMLKRDRAIAMHLVALKATHGYPKTFRAAYAKKTTPDVFEVGCLLADAGMSKGVTLSAQSMDLQVLENVKRRPIKEPEFIELLARYQARDVPTYTEIILGLPGESRESFGAGIGRILELGQHDGLNVYPAILLPNSELATPESRTQWGIESKVLPMLLLHGSPGDDPTPETYELVIATNTMPHHEWEFCMMFAWVVQGLHCLPLLQHVARELHRLFGIQYQDFYGRLISDAFSDRGRRETPLLHASFLLALDSLRKTLAGTGTWNTVEPAFGSVVWPPEELIFLRCASSPVEFYDQLWPALLRAEVPENVIREQVIDSQRMTPGPGQSLSDWARDVVWYGRKGRRPKKLQEAAA